MLIHRLSYLYKLLVTPPARGECGVAKDKRLLLSLTTTMAQWHDLQRLKSRFTISGTYRGGEAFESKSDRDISKIPVVDLILKDSKLCVSTIYHGD